MRIAIVRYVQSGEGDDVSDAIERCCLEMSRHLPREIEQSSNDFRARFCYVEATADGTLWRAARKSRGRRLGARRGKRSPRRASRQTLALARFAENTLASARAGETPGARRGARLESHPPARV